MKWCSNKLQISAKFKCFLSLIVTLALLCSLFTIPAYAAVTTNNDVAGAMQAAFGTYMKPQFIKAVNGIVLPIIDAILIIFFVIKIVMAGINYHRNSGGQFEWHIPAILFAGLVISLTAPLWVWNILGI